LYDLDLNLDAPYSELSIVFGENSTTDLKFSSYIKHMRNFDVDNARAAWRVTDKVIVQA